MKNCLAKMVGITALSLMVIPGTYARTFDFKALGTKGSSSGGAYWYSEVSKKKSAFFQIKVGSAGKTDDKSKIEIRAATVFKSAKDRMSGVNDVATFSFDPVNTMKPIFFVVATGVASSTTDRYWLDTNRRSNGWQVAGVIIEIWQKGKVIKHWTNIPGSGGKEKLTEDVKQLFVHANGYRTGEDNFDNFTEIFAVDQKGQKVNIEDVLKDGSEPEDSSKPAESTTRRSKGNDDGGKEGGEDVAEGEFLLKSFCGFEFGSQKPAFSRQSGSREITMRKPFRHYTRARLEYGANSGALHAVSLYSSQRFDSDVERTEAAAAAAAVIEKKYGIHMEDCGSGFRFADDRHEIWVCATNISVRRRDLKEKDEILQKAIREATKRQIKSTEGSDDGSDVL